VHRFDSVRAFRDTAATFFPHTVKFVDRAAPGRVAEQAQPRFTARCRSWVHRGYGIDRAEWRQSNSGAKIPLALKARLYGLRGRRGLALLERTTAGRFPVVLQRGLLSRTFALWLESPLLCSMQAIGVLFWQFLWQIDFCCRPAPASAPSGRPTTCSTGKLPLFVRGLSLSHLFLPYLLLWLSGAWGSDRRAVWAQTLCAWAVLIVSLRPGREHGGAAGNVNKIFGLSDAGPQDFMPRSWVAGRADGGDTPGAVRADALDPAALPGGARPRARGRFRGSAAG
jgi:hypothetical protein